MRAAGPRDWNCTAPLSISQPHSSFSLRPVRKHIHETLDSSLKRKKGIMEQNPTEVVHSIETEGVQGNERGTSQVWRNTSRLPEAELNKLVEDVLNLEDRPRGTFIADDGRIADDDKERNIAKQLLKASLAKGYISNEMVAVDISNRIDFEYGNKGPEVNPDQQLINNGRLFAENKAAVIGTEKQRQYRSLVKFRSIAPAMSDQLEALEQDEDVHSVSEVSLLGNRPWENDKPCAIDCPLKTHLKMFPSNMSKLPDLNHFVLGDSSAAEIETKKSKKYEELKPGQMRILELLPGNFGDPVECKLQAVPVKGLGDLDNCSSAPDAAYEALSYTWGKQRPQFSISCNGTPFLVGRNLFFALQHLRQKDKSSIFWIDAVCIDQKNDLEKAEQVQQILEIYKGAERVLVWLGEESDDSHFAIETMKFLDKFRNERHEIWDRGHNSDCYAVLNSTHQAHANLLTRSWFTRSWIRQEISAAKDVLVVCGRDTLSWYTLKRSNARLSDIRRKLEKDPASNAKVSAIKSNINYLIREWVSGQRLIGLIGFIGSMWYFHSGGLLELLMTAREFDATDPRDKVYSVLGLAKIPMTTDPYPDDSPNFPVAYTKSVSEVYQDAVKYFINRDRNLDIISILLSHRNDKSTDLPSWTPDWRVPASEIPLDRNWDFFTWKMAAGGYKLEAPIQSYAEVGILRVQGYLVTKIRQCDNVTTGLYNLLQPIIEAQDLKGLPKEAKRKQEFLNVKPFDPSTHTTRCCRTESEEVCLAPANVQPGDTVAILIGGKTMFVLQPLKKEQHSAGLEMRAHLVGPCILPNFMFGAGISQARENHHEPIDIVLV